MLETQSRELQVEVTNTKNHEVLSREDFSQRYWSPLLSKVAPETYLNRLVVTVGPVTEMGQTALVTIKIVAVRKNLFG